MPDWLYRWLYGGYGGGATTRTFNYDKIKKIINKIKNLFK